MNRIRKGYALRLAQRLREMGHESIDAEVSRLSEEAQWLINDKSMSVPEAFDRIEEALISSSPGPNVTQTAHEDSVFLCDDGLGGLVRQEKETLKERIPPKTFRWLDEYFVCADCGKLFWKGTHWMRIDEQLRTIIT